MEHGKKSMEIAFANIRNKSIINIELDTNLTFHTNVWKNALNNSNMDIRNKETLLKLK